MRRTRGRKRPSLRVGGSGSGADGTLNALATLKPLGQLRDSFILAANDEGLWIIDQHVAHERVLFEKILRAREVEQVQRQRLLMPLLVDLLPAQMVSFAAIARELELNGFEAEPFGPRTLAIKAAPVGLEGRELERMLEEVLAGPGEGAAGRRTPRRGGGGLRRPSRATRRSRSICRWSRQRLPGCWRSWPRPSIQ